MRTTNHGLRRIYFCWEPLISTRLAVYIVRDRVSIVGRECGLTSPGFAPDVIALSAAFSSPLICHQTPLTLLKYQWHLQTYRYDRVRENQSDVIGLRRKTPRELPWFNDQKWSVLSHWCTICNRPNNTHPSNQELSSEVVSSVREKIYQLILIFFWVESYNLRL